MRKAILGAATAFVGVLFAAPASADEVHFEAMGGVHWDSHHSEAVAGLAAGYDFDLSDTIFVGAEMTAEKILKSGKDVHFGTAARIGIFPVGHDRLYVLAGHTFGSHGVWNAGAGYEHAMAEHIFLKAEYRQFFEHGDNGHAVLLGIGMMFARNMRSAGHETAYSGGHH